MTDNKGITITNAFQKILDESNRKLNLTWVDKGNAFYSRSMKSWLQDNYIEKEIVKNEEKQLQKSNQKEFRVEKIIKIKGDKLYFK